MYTQLKDCLFYFRVVTIENSCVCVSERVNVYMCWNFKQWICNMMIFDTSHLSKYTMRWIFAAACIQWPCSFYRCGMLLILGLHSGHAHIQIQTQNAVWIHNWWHVVINAHDFNDMLIGTFVSILFIFIFFLVLRWTTIWAPKINEIYEKIWKQTLGLISLSFFFFFLFVTHLFGRRITTQQSFWNRK